MMTSLFRALRAVVVVAAALVFAAALAGCATTAHHDHGHHDDAGSDGRLLVGLSSGTIAVFDAHDGDLLARFEGALPEGSIAVYAGPSGEFGYALQRAASVVAVVDSGQILAEHDGHEDLELGEISILAHLRDGRFPTHFTSTAGLVGIYNDESGDITVLEEASLRGGVTPLIVPARVDHGAPVLLQDRLIVGYVGQTAIEMMDYTGRVVQSFDGIARAHGQARIGRYTAFGTADGVYLVTQTGSDFAGRLIRKPEGTPDNVRTGTLTAHPRLAHFVGNLGSGMVEVNPLTLSSTAHPLPAAPWRFAIDRSGDFVVVLGADGVVYVLDSETFALRGSVPAVAARLPDAPAGTPVPSLAVGRRVAYLSDPSTGRILVIHLDDAEIEDEFTVDLGGTITSIALLATDGVTH